MNTAMIVPVLLLAAVPAVGGADGPADLTPAVNAFTVDTYQALRTGDGNIFLSPASISYALGMTRSGARGATATEMDRVLHLPTDGTGAVAAYGDLMGVLDSEGRAHTLRLANRLYGQTGLAFRPEFLATVRDFFGGGFEQVDYRSDADGARRTINAWVSDRTEERIPELLASGTVNESTRLVLVNAIYFLGDWKTPFPAESTHPQDFHLTDTTTASVPMMNETASFGYAAADDVQILTMPYEGDELEMVVVLPAEDLGLAGLEARLTTGTLADWLAAPTRARVAVTLPKFEFTAEFQLGHTLAEMGMPTAFGDAADFSGMIDGGGLAIDNVVHKAYVRVDEKGTEAAAATGVTMRATSVMPAPPEVFTADRPFLFLIRHKPSGTVLFLGRVVDPRG